jgi:ATP-binding protein involved in chromosome partitioning
MTISRESVADALSAINDPYIDGGLAGVLTDFSVGEKSVLLRLTWPYPLAGIRESLALRISEELGKLDPTREFKVQIDWQIASLAAGKGQPVAGVRNVIAVASGKGGVGKSTVAVNLALALQAEGARVGLLDADIYGPSQGSMMGVAEGTRPEVSGESSMEPIIAHGIQCMSMSFLVSDRTPMVWRGPMASGALNQLITQTHWQELDYLIVDMPPGTGDIQLTLSQQVSLSGAVIVTTPQDIALLDARKGIEMFSQVNVPVLGIVENMSVHICSACGNREHIFGTGGGQAIASQYGTRLLAGLPLSVEIRRQLDEGTPPVAVDPESETSLLFREIARAVAAALVTAATEQPVISITDD